MKFRHLLAISGAVLVLVAPFAGLAFIILGRMPQAGWCFAFAGVGLLQLSAASLLVPDEIEENNSSAAWAEIVRDGEVAERAKAQISSISHAYHILSECQATELFLHPADDVILPYIVMTNRGMDGLLRFCGMTVAYDHSLAVGDWRIK